MGQPTAWPSGPDPLLAAGESTPDGSPPAGQPGWGDSRVPDPRQAFHPAAPGGDNGARQTGVAKPERIRRRGTLLGVRSGQLVAAELAAVVLLVAAGAGTAWLVVAAPLAAGILLVAFGRIRRHWAYEWLGLGSRFLGRRRTLQPGADATDLLGLLRPAAVMTSVDVDAAAVGVIEDAFGLTAVIELGDPAALLADATPLTASPAELLPPANPAQPRVRLQLLVSGMPAPSLRAGSGSPATSYRQLTEGRILALQRSFLALHVHRSGGFGDAELRRALSSAVRRARRRLDRDELPCRPLGADTATRVLGELAHLDTATALQEDWSGVQSGGLRQVSFRLRRWPDITGELGRSLLPRLLALPGAGTTVSLAAERVDAEEVRVELVIRLASPGPQSQAAALGGLRRLLDSAGAAAHRLDGTQLAGLGATLPLGGAADPGAAGMAGVLDSSAAPALVGDAGMRATTQMLAALELPLGGAGLVMGVNRHGEPTTVRLFRPEPTRMALFGGLRYTQLVALRALALGAQVVIQTGRPQSWEPFMRGVSGPGEALALAPPNRSIELAPATPLSPQLIIVDVGPVGATGVTVVEAAWRATLVVRDDLAPHDLDILARADVVVLPALSAPEAEIAGTALGLGQLSSHLPRVRPDMVGVVVGRRTLRWTLLSATPIEQQLIGTITR
jgi:type VII secretion protein EccE